MALNVGELTREVVIQQLTDSVGNTRFPVETWTTLHAAASMSREEVKGAERYGADQLSAQATTRWTMRYVADMDPELVDVPKTRRLLYAGRVYDITSATHLGRKDGIELMTLAKVG